MEYGRKPIRLKKSSLKDMQNKKVFINNKIMVSSPKKKGK